MNRDLFSGTICQCGDDDDDDDVGWDFPIASGQTGHRKRPKRGGYPAKQTHTNIHIHILLTCECFAPGQKDTQHARNSRNYSGGNSAAENVVIYGLIIINRETHPTQTRHPLGRARMQSSWKLILSQLRIVAECHYDIDKPDEANTPRRGWRPRARWWWWRWG